MVRPMRAAIVKVKTSRWVRKEMLIHQVFSTKYSLTLPATALSYIEQVLTEVRHITCQVTDS